MNTNPSKHSSPGARFYRSALQVNSFDYLQRHNRRTSYADETSYNDAIVQACRRNNIEVIGVTDHYHIKGAASLIAAAQAAGIYVFPGFEAVSKDGVHFLCLLDPSSSLELVQNKIAACGVHNDSELSPNGKFDACELLDECHNWDVRCIAAHVAGDGGLLCQLRGKACIDAWKHQHLLAASLPGPAENAPENLRPIVLNRDNNYRRERAIAILNSQDVCDPADLDKASTSCWIKMSKVTTEGLRQAFLDPDSRIRLANDPVPEEHTEFASIAWDTNAFLRGCSIDLNENLNVLVGGRGTGKSTIIESIRYALDLQPASEDAKKAHESIIRHVVRSGTKITLRVHSSRPDRRTFVIERTVPNPPQVKDEQGNVLDVAPADIVPTAEVYGQHEISDLAKSPQKLTLLLERFVEYDPSWTRRVDKMKTELAESRRDILDSATKLSRMEEELATLPARETTLSRYRDAGVEEKLAEQDKIVRENGLLDTARKVVEPLETAKDELEELLPLDLAFIDDDIIKELPSADSIKALRTDLRAFEQQARKGHKVLEEALATVAEKIGEVQAVIDGRQTARSEMRKSPYNAHPIGCGI